ncbi:hypothetical protein K493DRAFT_304395 [Basidiobolus meristosporus CBS 931.73]|uniref:Telomere-associated protein Rif1 N-terminal domain-containing protein n=1 Tax=Basidiobolus meristosporus CBS 931.73 TaxID=1314790 RepID=A0A1Y1XZ84_9FUNG|nr:hypothetical protein K493DRAFT_304395 [Basidiobolus meristosporus CBS 931.73]|eukprot:ORX91042.1 hypothetical protein K493DRAFT_304395 [Basidiobolus meristosporus CBS 931.73]
MEILLQKDQTNLEDQKLELVYYMIKGLLQSLTPRTLVLTKYRMNEEERKLSVAISENASLNLGDKMRKQLSINMVVTPIVYIAKIWMDIFSRTLSPPIAKTYWEMYGHFIEISQNGPAVLDVFSSFFGLLSLSSSNEDALTAWSYIVKGLCYHIDESNTISEDLNPFADDSHEVIYEAFMFPIRIACKSPVYLKEEEQICRQSLLHPPTYLTTLVANGGFRFVWVYFFFGIPLETAIHMNIWYCDISRMVALYVEITRHFLDTLSFESGTMTNMLPGVQLFRKTIPDNQHSAKELSPSQILGIICGILFQKLYDSLDLTLPEPYHIVTLTEGLFSSITSAINKASRGGYITVIDYLTLGFSKWLQDEDGHILSQCPENQQSYYKMVDVLWGAVLERVNSLPDLTTQDALFHLSTLLIAGANSSREQIKITSAQYLKKFLEQCSPDDVPLSLQPLLRSNVGICVSMEQTRMERNAYPSFSTQRDIICERVEFRREVTPESPAIRPKPRTPKKKLASPAAIAEYNELEGTPSHGARVQVNQTEQFRRDSQKLNQGKYSAVKDALLAIPDGIGSRTPVYWKGKRKASTPFKSPTMNTPCIQVQSTSAGSSQSNADDEPETPTKRLRCVKISADTPANLENTSPTLRDQSPKPTLLPPPKFDLRELSALRHADDNEVERLLGYINELLESRDLLEETSPSTLAQLHTKLNKLSETIVQTLAQKVVDSTP